MSWLQSPVHMQGAFLGIQVAAVAEDTHASCFVHALDCMQRILLCYRKCFLLQLT